MAEERFYLTADLRVVAGIPRTTLDYYLRVKLITPTARSENGFLLFNAEERDRLLRIVDLRRQGYSIRESRQQLDQGQQAASTTPN